jgi:uncharacterized membrane protein YeaQ/YmgE (transglycosylase-associated protein family)
MGILAWIVLGGVAGWLASIVMGTDGSQGIFGNIIVGIIGALIGGFLFDMFGGAGITGFNFYSLLVATIGAAALIWVVKLVRG